jgi:hypothetical protein
MRSRSRQALVQMSIVLTVVLAAVLVVAVWRWPFVRDVFLADWKSVLLNGVVVLVFAMGVGQLYRAFLHYAAEEGALTRFRELRERGHGTREILDDADPDTLLGERYHTVRALFERGVPIDHGAIAAITVAAESSRRSFPRFVNGVLILTGVFGTVSSLIFALIGASDVLRSAVPGEGMGVMLLGMNTALTTTATAIVCFFLYSYFYQKLTDVQTSLMSRLERVVLVDVIPEFQFDPQAVEHQTKLLLNELAALVAEIRLGVTSAQRSLADLEARAATESARWDTALANQQEHQRRLDGLQSGLDTLREVLREGFRLR